MKRKFYIMNVIFSLLILSSCSLWENNDPSCHAFYFDCDDYYVDGNDCEKTFFANCHFENECEPFLGTDTNIDTNDYFFDTEQSTDSDTSINNKKILCKKKCVGEILCEELNKTKCDLTSNCDWYSDNSL